LKCATGEIQEYLEQVQKFFEDLSHVNGAFRIIDCDEKGRGVVYGWWSCSQDQSDGERIPEEKYKYWMAAQPSLLAERTIVRISPGFVPRYDYK
jgi:hypothetical protein